VIIKVKVEVKVKTKKKKKKKEADQSLMHLRSLWSRRDGTLGRVRGRRGNRNRIRINPDQEAEAEEEPEVEEEEEEEERRGQKSDVPPPNGELVTQEIPRSHKLLRGESSVFFEFGFFEDLKVLPSMSEGGKQWAGSGSQNLMR
jgi:hypothetical protein